MKESDTRCQLSNQLVFRQLECTFVHGLQTHVVNVNDQIGELFPLVGVVCCRISIGRRGILTILKRLASELGQLNSFFKRNCAKILEKLVASY
jgi:hypothetical protein